MSESKLSFNIEANNVVLNGELDRFTVADLINQFRFNQSQHEQVVIDFTKVTKADTAGLAWLLKVKATTDIAGQQLILNAMPQSLQQLAKLSGVDTLLVQNK